MEVALLKEEGGFLDPHEVCEVDQQPSSPRKMAQIVKILRTKGDEAFYGFLRWLCDFGHDAQVRELAGSAGLERAIATEPGTGSQGLRRLRLRPVAVVKPLVVKQLVVKQRHVGAPHGRGAVVQQLTRAVQTGCRNGVRLALFGLLAGCSTGVFFMTGVAIGSFLPSVGAIWGGCALASVGVAMSAKAATQVGARAVHFPDRPDGAANAELTISQLLRKMVCTRRITCLEATRLMASVGAACSINGLYSFLFRAANVGFLPAMNAGLLPFVGTGYAGCLLGIAGSLVLFFSFQSGEQRFVAFLNRPTDQGDGIRAPATALPG